MIKIAETFEKVEELMLYFSFDVIVIDAKSPGVDVEKVTRYIKSQEDYPFRPILVLSGSLKKTFLRQMLQLGVTDFLNEPLETEEVISQIKAAVQTTEKRAKMTNLTPNKLLDRDNHAPPLKGVHLVSSKLEKAVEEALLSGTHLALLQVQLDKSAKAKEAKVLLLLQKQMRQQDILIHKSERTFLCLLPNTSARAALFIAENLFEKLEEEKIAYGIGGSSVEPPFPVQEAKELALQLEKEAFEAVKTSLSKKKVVIAPPT